MNSNALILPLTTIALFCTARLVADEETAQTPAPPYEVVELYAPGHFGNGYECMGQYEMLDMLREAKFWGCTRYGDWFDMLDCSDPFRKDVQWGLGRALWWAKKLNFRSAAKAGLQTDFVLTPNHVYIDQRHPPLLAEEGTRRGQRMFGQLICPSKPEARRLILQNYERLFADLARSGVRLNAMSAGPYDYGGCGCDKCHPWIITWSELTYEIYRIARQHHPNIEMTMIGWWWKPEEHKLFADWADKHHPGWLKAMFVHIPYGKTTIADVPLPKGCAKGAFVHIGYADSTSRGDIYGSLGPMVAPKRLQETLQGLKKQGVTHLMAYSEGPCDNVNKAIFAGLGAGKFKTADEVLTAYAKRYFGTDDATSAQWAEWLAAWGESFDRDTTKAKSELVELLAKTPKRDSPRVREWVLKTELFDINRKIGVGDNWTPQRLELVEQFFQTREKIHRGVWGLGPLRHIFARKYLRVPWFHGWAKHQAAEAGKLGADY